MVKNKKYVYFMAILSGIGCLVVSSILWCGDFKEESVEWERLKRSTEEIWQQGVKEIDKEWDKILHGAT